ncbi:ribosomal L28 family protein [Plectosphaerella plurivora]|uniref:Ribosomal L28 family protein n=1 Tax=Plectosphaerella plurivora TaxID=936078 RepID=A0A9P8VE99_9PEZI|nr:ribosomal L28 family protein [Plectosphaerella plurivora]
MSVFAAAQRGSASIRGLTTSFRSISLSSSTAAPAFSSRTIPAVSRAAFSTTTAQQANESTKHLPTIPISRLRGGKDMPAYPYGPRLIYKQSNLGLHGNLRPRVGCNVSEDHKVRTKRTWRPNIHRKRLWSDALGAFVRTRVSIRVLRTIRKEGGLDNYILGVKSSRMKELGPAGWRLRYLLMQTDAIQNQHAAEAIRLGVVDQSYLEFDPANGMNTEELDKTAAMIGKQLAAETISGEFDLGDEIEELHGLKGRKAKRP